MDQLVSFLKVQVFTELIHVHLVLQLRQHQRQALLLLLRRQLLRPHQPLQAHQNQAAS